MIQNIIYVVFIKKKFKKINDSNIIIYNNKVATDVTAACGCFMFNYLSHFTFFQVGVAHICSPNIAFCVEYMVRHN